MAPEFHGLCVRPPVRGDHERSSKKYVAISFFSRPSSPSAGLIHGSLYEPESWTDAAKLMLQTYQTLVAAANTSSTFEARSSLYASLKRQQGRWTRRHFVPTTVETKRKRTSSTRDFAEEPNYDFSPATIAIACGDGIDTPHVTTTDVFGEIIHAASTVSQMIGPEWFFTLYCHRCVPFHAVCQLSIVTF